MKRLIVATTCAWLALGFAACSSSSSDSPTTPPGATGGTGGSSAPSGGSATGGQSGGNGGSVTSGGTGGNSAASGGSGGIAASGGPATGGQSGGNAGSEASGGASATGGSSAGGAGAEGGSATAGSGGGTPYVEPALVTSAQNAYWKAGALTEVTSGNADVTVDDATMFQTWDGFGGSFSEAGWDVMKLLTAAERDRAMNLLFGVDGARFAFGRIPIGSNDYAVERYTLNENAGDYTMAMFSVARDEQNIIPYVKAALAIKPDVRLWASPWTPPTWMKSNAAFDGGSMKDDEQTLGAFAIYLAKFVEEYAKVGIEIEAIHPQNEPNYETRYPSCIWTPELYTKFIRDHLGPTFASRSVGADIYLGTMSNADAGKDATILSTLTADAGAMAFIKGFGLQWNMINNVASLKSRNLPIVQTEHKCGNYPWMTGFNADKPPNDHAYGVESWGLIVDWVTAGATAYSAWNMVLDTAGKNLDMMRPWPQNALLVVDRTAKTLTVTPAYYVFRHLSEFVDPGAKRLGTTGGSALAFKNPDGTHVAVIYNSGAAKQSTVALGGKTVQFDLPANGWATINLK